MLFVHIHFHIDSSNMYFYVLQYNLLQSVSYSVHNFHFHLIYLKCTLCQVQKVCVLVNIAIFIWIVLLAALSYPFAYPAVGVKVTAGEAEPMP